MIHRYHCMLLASLGILPYGIIIFFCALCICYICLQIQLAYRSIYVFMHAMSVSLHSLSYNIETKGTTCNAWHSHDFFNVLSHMTYFFTWLSLTVTMSCKSLLWLLNGYCRWCQVWFECWQILFDGLLMHLCFFCFFINNLITITVITLSEGNHIHWVLCLSSLILF